MKKQFLEGIFKDFDGIERTFIVAAVPEKQLLASYSSDELEYILDLVDSDGCKDCIYDTIESPNSMFSSINVKFGVAFCHPKDINTNNPELGRKIAAGKAISKRSRVAEINFSSGMLISFDLIQSCLKKIAKDVMEHPEKYSKSYNNVLEKRKKWIKEHPLANRILTSDKCQDGIK